MPGGLSVPMLGPVGAPQIAMPTPLTQAAEAIGQFPADQRKAQMEQAEVDAQNLSTATQKLSVLNKMIANQPGIAADPQIVSAAQRAFKTIGMSAPTVSEGGTTRLDAQAMGAYAPAHDFVAQNLGMLLNLAPDQRAGLIGAATGAVVPPEMEAMLQKLPQKFLQSPQEATGLLTYVRTAVQNIGKPGGSIENAIAAISAAAAPLSEIGINSDMLVQQLKPDLYQSAMQAAQLALVNAKTGEQQALAQKNIQELPAQIESIQNLADLRKVMATLAPEKVAISQENADAHVTSANAAAENAGTNRSEMTSKIAYYNGQAARDAAEVTHLHAQTTEITQGVTAGTAEATKLLAIANNAQQLHDRLQAAYTNALTDVSASTDPAVKKRAQTYADSLLPQIEQAAKDGKDAHEAYTNFQAKTKGGTQPVANSRFGNSVGTDKRTGKLVYQDSKGAYVYDDGTPVPH